MNNIKKIIPFLVVFAIISSLSMMAFAADVNIDFDTPLTLEVKFNPTEANSGDTITADFYLYSTDDKSGNVVFDGGGDSAVEFTFDSSVLEKTGAKMGYGFSDSSISDNRCFIEAKNTYSVNAEAPLFTLTFNVKNNVAADKYSDLIKFGDVLFANGDGAETSAVTTIVSDLTVKGSTPVEPKAEIDTNDDVKSNEITLDNGTKYIDVPTYVGKVAVSGELNGKNVKITPVVKYNGTDVTSTLKKVDSIIIPGASFDKGAKIEFKFAIVGAPTTGTIDLSATAVPVE